MGSHFSFGQNNIGIRYHFKAFRQIFLRKQSSFSSLVLNVPTTGLKVLCCLCWLCLRALHSPSDHGPLGIYMHMFAIIISAKMAFDGYTAWPKSNVSKVRAYCLASDHLIRKIFSGMSRVSHWFEEYLKIIEIGDYFFE